MDSAVVFGPTAFMSIDWCYHRHHCVAIARNWGHQSPDTDDHIVVRSLQCYGLMLPGDFGTSSLEMVRTDRRRTLHHCRPICDRDQLDRFRI